MLNWITRVLDDNDHLMKRKDLLTLFWAAVVVALVLIGNSIVG